MMCVTYVLKNGKLVTASAQTLVESHKRVCCRLCFENVANRHGLALCREAGADTRADKGVRRRELTKHCPTALRKIPLAHHVQEPLQAFRASVWLFWIQGEG